MDTKQSTTERRSLNSTAVLNAMLFPLLVSFIAFGILIFTNIHLIPVIPLVFLTAVACAILAARNVYNIEYDEHCIYLNGIFSRHEFPLSSVRSIKQQKDGIRITGLSSWKYWIELDESTGIHAQLIWSQDGNGVIGEFISAVRSLNQEVVVG